MSFPPRYVVELISGKTPYTIVFESLSRDNGLNPPNMSPVQHVEWKTMPKNKYPIRICSINGLQVVDGYAVADILEWRYGGTTLSGILLNGYYYSQEYMNVEYWFPGLEKPEYLVDGSIRVCTNMKSNKEIAILIPLDTIPFMDTMGGFIYDYMMVAKEINTGKEYEYTKCQIPVTLYQVGNQFKKIIYTTPIRIEDVRTCNLNEKKCKTIQEQQIDGFITFHDIQEFIDEMG